MRGPNFSFGYQTRFEGHSLGTGLIVGVNISFKEFLSLDQVLSQSASPKRSLGEPSVIPAAS